MYRTPPLLRAALSAAACGWPVLPLFPGSKRPAIAGWQHHASCDPAVLGAWWERRPYNPLTGLPRDPPRQMAATVPITRRTSSGWS